MHRHTTLQIYVFCFALLVLQGCFFGSAASDYVEPTEPVTEPVSPDYVLQIDADTMLDVPELPTQVSFSGDVLPIFESYGCLDCHGGEGGLDLTTISTLLRTGDHAPVVIPCDPDNSLLLQKLESDPPFGSRMPLNGDPLPDDAIAIIRLWIAGGGNPEACQEPLDAGMNDVAVEDAERDIPRDLESDDSAMPDILEDTAVADTAEDIIEDTAPDVPEDTQEPDAPTPDVAADIEDEPREPRTEQLDYALDVKPMLERHSCLGCHGGVARLYLNNANNARAGGLLGPGAIPCDPDNSLLVIKVEPNPPSGRRMPTRGGFMPDVDIALLRQWIAEGAEQTYNPDTCSE